MFNLDEALRNHLDLRKREKKLGLSPLCYHAQSKANHGFSSVSPMSLSWRSERRVF
jgi:hypothetical protein